SLVHERVEYIVTIPAPCYIVFYSNYTSTPEIYTLSLHDALPISGATSGFFVTISSVSWVKTACSAPLMAFSCCGLVACPCESLRSEEHTSELQSRGHLVCRLLLEKKKKKRVEFQFV